MLKHESCPAKRWQRALTVHDANYVSYGPDWERQHRGGPGPEPRPGLLIRAEHNGLGGHRVIEHRGVQRAVHRARQRPSPGHHRLDCMKDPVRPIRGRQPPPIRQRRARGPGDRARFAAYAARWPARPKSLRRNAPPMIATTSVSPRSPGMTVTPGIGWSGPWSMGVFIGFAASTTSSASKQWSSRNRSAPPALQSGRRR